MRRFLVIPGISIVIIVVCGLAYFYFFPKQAQNILVPEVDQIKTASIKLRGDTAYLDLHIRFKNKGIFKLNIDTLDYNIMFDTLNVLSKQQALKLVLNAGDIDSMIIPVALPYKRIVKRIGQLQSRDSTDITTKVRIVYNTVFGKTVLPYEKVNRIGTPRPPEFELEKIEYVKKDGKAFLFLAHLKMINHGQLTLTLYDIKYKIKLKDLVEAQGEHKSEIKVTPLTTIREQLPLRAEFSHLWKAVKMVIKDEDIVPYTVRITAMLEGSEGHEPTKIELDSKGQVELKK